MSDWFAQNAPAATPAAGDWFTRNAPAAADKPALERASGAFFEYVNPVTMIPAMVNTVLHPSTMFTGPQSQQVPNPDYKPPVTAVDKLREILGGNTKTIPAGQLRANEDQVPVVGEALNGKIPEALGHLAAMTIGAKAPEILGKGAGLAADTAGAIKRGVANVDPALAKDLLGIASPRAAHAIGTAQRVNNILTRFRNSAAADAATIKGPYQETGFEPDVIETAPAAPRTPPGWQSIPDAASTGPVAPPPPAPPATLPSGRVPGSLATQQPLETTPAAAGEASPAIAPEVLDSVSRSVTGRPFAKLKPNEARIVQTVASRLQPPAEAPAPAAPPAAPAPAPVEPTPAAVQEAPAPVEPTGVIAASDTSTPSQPPPNSPAAIAQQLAEAMRGGDNTTTPAPAAAPAAEPVSFPQPADWAAGPREVKAFALADALFREGISVEDAKKLDPHQLRAKLAAHATRWEAEHPGEKAPDVWTAGKKPPSPLTRNRALEILADKHGSGSSSEPLQATGTDGPVAQPPAGPTLQTETPNDGRSTLEPQGQTPPDGAGIRAGVESAPVQQASGASPGAAQQTKVRVPGEARSYPARYDVRELADVQPSHHGATFERNPKYELTNERDYNNPENQGKVVRWSTPAEFDPAYMITDNPSATDGPPVIDAQGNVIGGNGRSMILQRVYDRNPGGAQEYRQLLASRAPYFGVDPAKVAGMKQPVLVRQIDFDSPEVRQQAVTDFNKSGTAALTPAERALSDARRVSPETLEDFGSRLEARGPDATVAQVLEGKSGISVLNRLIDDGVISPQERAAYADGDALTADGKTRITRLMFGRYFRDPAQFDRIPPSLRDKVAGIAPSLARAEMHQGWSLTPAVQEALDLAEDFKAHGGKNLQDYLNQSGLFGSTQYSPEAVTIAQHLLDSKPTMLKNIARQYAQDAKFASEGNPLFGAAPTPAGSFGEAFGRSK
jgi:DdrB-like nuclease